MIADKITDDADTHKHQSWDGEAGMVHQVRAITILQAVTQTGPSANQDES